MKISAVYICPVRGLAGPESPDQDAVREASRTAAALGLHRLELPVTEEALTVPAKVRVKYLDGLISALDRIADACLSAALIVPAQRLLRIDYIPPYLAGASPSSDGKSVFTAGRFRELKPFPWWKDLSIIETRIKLFREAVSALTGHPAIAEWVLMDRLMSWSQPVLDTAEMFFRSHLAEIRERDESAKVSLNVDGDFFLSPARYEHLLGLTDGLRLAGLDQPLAGFPNPKDLVEEITRASYLGALAGWLTGKPVEVEVGWHTDERADPDLVGSRLRAMAEHGIHSLTWFNFADPEPGQAALPPWQLNPGLNRAAICDPRFQPKEWVEQALSGLHSIEPKKGAADFIDIDRNEYRESPVIHLARLWDHFRETLPAA